MTLMTDIPAGRSVRSALTSLATTLTDGIVAIGRARARSEEIERFMALSDEELAARGMKREDIVRYVFRDQLAI